MAAPTPPGGGQLDSLGLVPRAERLAPGASIGPALKNRMVRAEPGRRGMGSIMTMVPADSRVGETPAVAARLDPQSAEWLQALAGAGVQREAALARFHGLLDAIEEGGVRRRWPRLRM